MNSSQRQITNSIEIGLHFRLDIGKICFVVIASWSESCVWGTCLLLRQSEFIYIQSGILAHEK